MSEVQRFVRIRVSEVADAKLSQVAKAGRLTKTEALSRIILSYAGSGSGMEAISSEGVKAIMDKLSGIHVVVSKNAGAAERTESFIKGLLRDTRVPAAREQEGAVSETEVTEQVGAETPGLSALGLLDRLFPLATKGVNFDGTPVMQIKLSMEEFLRFQAQYEQLCTSRNT